MATIVDFTPSGSANFTFQATFDGTAYNLVVNWNYGGQRYYVNCYTIQGDLVYCLPLIGSPPDYAININGGYFTTTLVYRVENAQFEIG